MLFAFDSLLYAACFCLKAQFKVRSLGVIARYIR
jgi:hypothetical protein